MTANNKKDSTTFNPRLVRVESPSDAFRLLHELGTDKGGAAIMHRKMQHLVIEAENVQARAAHIVKEVMLSKGGECATPRDVFFKDKEPVRVLMMGTIAQFREAAKNFAKQPFRLPILGMELRAVLDDAFPEPGTRLSMDAGPFNLVFGGRTLVMGVINVTPDSFSDGGEYDTLEAARARAMEMVDCGIDVIDVGGESTRPGSDPVDTQEEIRRTMPLIESISGDAGIPISIDTCKAGVARRALGAGATIVNDVSGLRFDPEMIPLVAANDVPVIIMHMQGTPRDMQENPTYEDVVADISRFLRERINEAEDGGVNTDKIIVDPGIGFGKTVEHNLEIMRRLEEFRSLGCPLLVGTSRKRFIGEVLDAPVGERLLGTAATVAFAIARGVDMVRVHDVAEMEQVVRMADAMAGKRMTGELR